LEQFLGNTALAFILDGPISIPEVVNRFIGNVFLEILVEQSNFTMLKMQTNTKTPQKNSCNNHFDGQCQKR
jgi:hypothetical protein